MAHLVKNPHFHIPFKFEKGGCHVLEENSTQEITQCGEVALRYERGQRMAIPDFGLPDQAMLQGGGNLNEIASAVEQHDDRISARVDREQIIRNGIDKVRVTIGGQRNG